MATEQLAVKLVVFLNSCELIMFCKGHVRYTSPAHSPDPLSAEMHCVGERFVLD